MKNVTSVIRPLLPPLTLMALIFAISSIPGPTTDNPGFLGLIPPTLQNLAHVPMFALLAWLWIRAWVTKALAFRMALLFSAAISTTWALLDEFHQFFVPGRYSSLTDIALNFLGVALGLLAYRFWHPNS